MRAWIAAGRPKADVPEIGSYGVWSDLCRQSLLWLGEVDPAHSLIAQVESDPDADALATFMRAWHMEFGKQAVMVRTVVDRAEADPDSDLWQSMEEMPFMVAKGVDKNRFGHYLKKNVNRVAGGLQLLKAAHSERNAWAVVPAGSEPSGFEPHVKKNVAATWARSTGHAARKPEVVGPDDVFE